MKRLLVSASVVAAIMAASSTAMAQDVSDWSGPYVGVFGGYTDHNHQDKEFLRFDRNLDGNFGDPVTTGAGADAFSPGSCGSAASGTSVAAGCDGDSSGVQGGVRAGYDMQFGNFVVGALGEYAAVKQEDSVTSFSTTPASYTFTRNLEQLASARLRAGFAYGPALIYGTGGYAWGKIDNKFITSNSANSFTATTDDDQADGWQAGGGVEYKLAPNLSVTGEYLYTSLEAPDYVIRVGQGTAPATNPFVLAPNTTGTDMMRSNGRFGLHAVNIGMNYRF